MRHDNHNPTHPEHPPEPSARSVEGENHSILRSNVLELLADGKRDIDNMDEIAIFESLHEHYFSRPPGLDRLASMPIPKLNPMPQASDRKMVSAVTAKRGKEAVILTLEKRKSIFSTWRGAGVAALAAAAIVMIALGWNLVGDTQVQQIRNMGQAASELTTGVRSLAMAGTDLKASGEFRAVMSTGSAWFWVQPNGKGFKLSTPLGEATVTGTVFGVSLVNNVMNVEVLEGSVYVTHEDDNASIKAGQSVQTDDKGLETVKPRADGQKPPVWVQQAAIKNAREAFAERVLPSVGGRVTP